MNFFKNINKQLIAATCITAASINPCHGSNGFEERLYREIETKIRQKCDARQLSAEQTFFTNNKPLFTKIAQIFAQLLLKEIAKQAPDKQPTVSGKKPSRRNLAIVQGIFKQIPFDQMVIEIKSLPATINIKITPNPEFIKLAIQTLASTLTEQELGILLNHFYNDDRKNPVPVYENLGAKFDYVIQGLQAFFETEIQKALQEELQKITPTS